MRLRPSIWILLCLLLAAGAWLFWRQHGSTAEKNPAANPTAAAQRKVITPNLIRTTSASTAPKFSPATLASTNSAQASASAAKTNKFAYRLTNTKKTIGDLVNDRHAILLENALIDTGAKLNLSIPRSLQSAGDPGAYIVQANGPIDNAFRAMLAAAGAQIVSYIPNDAYLVRISAAGMNAVGDDPMTAAVIPYEPYYKLSPSLLEALLANQQSQTLAASEIKVAAFPDTGAETETALGNSGAKIVAQESSPFGEVFTVQNVNDVAAVARLPGVQLIEPFHTRAIANDLARVTLGISTDTLTATNYLGLSGKNVIVEVNDTGIDATHPDFSAAGNAASGPSGATRVMGDAVQSLVDTDGHGTHVAGIIAGNGSESHTLTNTPQGSVTNADFRGKAPMATLYSVGGISGGSDTNIISDQYFQEVPALTNALISNNSWVYVGDNEYDLAAASYDAAVRDALPEVTGSQPVLFVFAAGNFGDGDNDGGGGDADSITSPGTAKNVITVGALEQLRNITNIVTDINGNSNAVWQPQTDSSSQVAYYSSRGNVGIGTEGAFGRFKPDVVAPGSFVVSTRSEQWDQAAYYDPTNFYFDELDDESINADSTQFDSVSLNFFPPDVTFNSNIVGVVVQIFPNEDSPIPFPNLLIYVSHTNFPTPGNPSTYDFVETNEVSIPVPDGGDPYLAEIQNGNLFLTIVNTNNEVVDYDFSTEIIATNQLGNYFEVLSNLNDTIGPWYRYESGTSMSAPAVSGVLALMQDYFTNTLHLTPSPALLKAMLVNGAQIVGNYTYAITNGINFEGWGLPNLPDSIPLGITNQFNQPCSEFFLDQSPTNALATGDSHTFLVTIDTDAFAQAFPLEATLAWTDPPGDPAAAIKLVNNLDLVITNLDTGDVYFGNDIAPGNTFNLPWNTNNAPNLDSINNLENIILSPLLASRYSVTVVGRSVNVNAVTAQTNNAAGAYAPNIVQDFTLVISCSQGQVTDAFTVTDEGVVSTPTTGQDITYVGVTNTPLFNQFVGASSPLLGTNQVQLDSTNELVTLGQTNQWHFYVVTNNALDGNGHSSDVTNAAFITFLPDTLSIPRMGVFQEDDPANATTPEADIDLYVTTDPTLTNLNPAAISNCVNGVQIGASAASVFNGASLGRGGTEFVVDTNSTPGQVYYIGVKSEVQYASEYGFLPVFTATPFSQIGPNGDETVNGLLLPVNIPDGSPAHPGIAYVFALAIQPMVVQNVVVNDQIVHQNFGDLIGTLSHNGVSDVLNNHDSIGNPPGPYNFIYDDSGQGQFPGSQPSDGPGSLLGFTASQAIGPWILEEEDEALTHTGMVTALSLLIQPHQDLKQPGIDVTVQPGGFFNSFVDVPVGYTNLTVSATNISVEQMPSVPIATQPVELFVNLGSQPTLADTNGEVLLTNCPFGGTFPNCDDPGNSISIGPPLQPGRYFVTIYNPSTTPQTVFVLATLSFSASAISTVDYASSGQTPILDDAVTYSSILVTNTDIIQDFSVGLRVDHPRISDLVFHLISPDGTRYLLMENRGGATTNGAGATLMSTNDINIASSGGSGANTNFVFVGEGSGTLAINYNFFSIPDQMTVYDSTNLPDFSSNSPTLIANTGMTNGSGQLNIPFTSTSGYLTIIMNQFGNTNTLPGASDAWTYTAGGIQTNYLYLSFTEDTNRATTPIKFAPPPFVPDTSATIDFSDNFDSAAPGTYTTGNAVSGGIVLTNQVAITNSPPANSPPNSLAIENGAVLFSLPTVAGQKYILNYFLGSLVSETGGAATNANWQAQNFEFTATASVTPLVLNASGNGNFIPADAQVLTLDTNALVDDLSLTAVPGNLYYLPEEDISAINGQSALGTWQLEIQDDRAGAGLTNSLLSWQLEFQFANTNVPAASINLSGPHLPAQPTYFINAGTLLTVTNTASDSDPNPALEYFLLTAPTNATISTNGIILWTPTLALAGTTNLFTTEVVDTNSGAFDFNSFDVIVLPPVTFTNGEPVTNVLAAGSVAYYEVIVPTNADIATNALLFSSAPVNLFFNQTNLPASGAGGGDFTLFSNSTDGSTNLTASSAPPLVPGATYYLELQNTNGFAVTNVLEVSFHLITSPTNIVIFSITYTNMSGTNGFLLQWFAPTDDVFQVQWTGDLSPPIAWSTFSNIITYTGPPTPTNGLFSFFDNGSQTGGTLGLIRFYRLILLGSTSALTNGEPQTNSVAAHSTDYFLITVPTNADFATNILDFASAPLNLLFNQATPPTGSNPGDFTLLTNSTGGIGSPILGTNTVPPLIPGSTYYLGVQNTNNFAVNFAIEVDFHLVTNSAPVSTNISTLSIVAASMNGTNGFLLTWYAPTDDVFQVQWTDDLSPPIAWSTFSNIITYTGPPTPTNGLFSFFDDGSQTGGTLGPIRFYRLILLRTLTLPNQTNDIATVSVPLAVTNTATDSDTNLTLAYTLTSSPATSAMIDTNGVITWTPDPTNADDEFKFTTVVMDNGVPPLSATNSFTVFVVQPFSSFPSITNASVTATNVTLQWAAPTNDLFQVEWTTNLMPVIIWTAFPPVITSTNGTFTFTDTNAPMTMEFYRLVWLPLP